MIGRMELHPDLAAAIDGGVHGHLRIRSERQFEPGK
jgi:hypothetical protein